MKEVIVFTSATCAPCKQLKPDLEALQAEHGFSMRYVEMSHENAQEFMKFGVRSVPTTVCHDGVSEVGRFIGAQTPTAVLSQLQEWGVL